MKVLPFEHTDLVVYDEAYRKGKSHVICAATYPQCSFSLIGLILGESMQPFSYM